MRMNQDERRFDFHGLGLALKQAREEKGWTQAYVAELVGKTDHINVLSATVLSTLTFCIEKLIYGNVEQSDEFEKQVETGVLAFVLNVHNGAVSLADQPTWPEVFASLCSLFS